MDIEEYKRGEGIIGDSDFERIETILHYVYYSTFFSDP